MTEISRQAVVTMATMMSSAAFLTFSVFNYSFVLLDFNQSYHFVSISSRMSNCNYHCCYRGSAAVRLISIVLVSVVKAAAAAATAGSFKGKRHLLFKRRIGAALINQISQQTALIDQAGGVEGGVFRATAWRCVTLFYPLYLITLLALFSPLLPTSPQFFCCFYTLHPGILLLFPDSFTHPVQCFIVNSTFLLVYF